MTNNEPNLIGNDLIGNADGVAGSGHQLALALFEDMAPAGTGIEDAPLAVGFQRNNIFLDIADLGLSARRAIDVAYFIAAEDPEIRTLYETDLHFFKWLMAYGSNNRTHLKSVLREGQKAAIEVEDIDVEDSSRDRWISVPLLGPVGISNGKVVFEIPRQLQRHIKNPASSHFLSLRYVFKSLYAKILYDKLLPHLGLEVTPWISIDELRKWFCLEPDSYTEFKRLSSRILKPSVAQVSEVTDIEVSFTTRNIPGSKKVGHIAFRMSTSRAKSAQKAPMLALKELYVTLRDEFGLNGTQVMEIINNRDEWSDERIERAIEYTRFHIEQGNVKRSPAGYLMTAIKGDFTLGSAMKVIATQKAAGAQTSLDPNPESEAVLASVERRREVEELKRKADAEQGYREFLNLPVELRFKLLTEFCFSPGAKVVAKRLKVEPNELMELHEGNSEVQALLGVFVALRVKPTKRV